MVRKGSAVRVRCWACVKDACDRWHNPELAERVLKPSAQPGGSTLFRQLAPRVTWADEEKAASPPADSAEEVRRSRQISQRLHRPRGTVLLRPVLLFVLVGLATGCGNSHKIAFGKQVNEQIAAYEYARSVNLRAADLPALQSAGEEEEEDTATHSTLGLGGCRITNLAGVHSVHSPRFLTRTTPSVSALLSTGRSVGSSVLVFARKARPTADRLSRSPIFRECLRRAVDQSERFSYEHLESLKRLPTPLSGVRSFASRATVLHVLRGPFFAGRRFTEYEDVLGFLLGRAEVIELADSRGAPFPGKQERALLALLYSRAKKAKAP
jgi:hypothetical protein